MIRAKYFLFGKFALFRNSDILISVFHRNSRGIDSDHYFFISKYNDEFTVLLRDFLYDLIANVV